MAKIINCECGYTVRGETDDELLAEAQKHMQDAHPDMVGKVSDQDLLSQAQEA
jgi:predicted small metal-binding protein